MNEYVIINKTAIQKRIEEWEKELQELFKAPVGEYNSDYVSTLKQAVSTARDFLSMSTPLIPEIEKAIDIGISEFECNAYEVPERIKEIQENYISNLKLDI